MEWIKDYFFWVFGFCLLLLIITWVIKMRIAKGFVTTPPKARRFSIISLEFPGSDAALTQLISKIALPVRMRVLTHLRIDFLFMLALYPGIAILCLRIACHIHCDSAAGFYILALLAFAQLLAWIFDIAENLILIKKIKNPLHISEKRFDIFKLLVFFKFIIVFIGIDSVILVMLYVWLVGLAPQSLTVIIAIIAALFILFMLYKTWRRYQLRTAVKEALATTLT